MFPAEGGTRLLGNAMYSTLSSSLQKRKKNKRKEHSSAYFLENWKRCKGAYQEAAENECKEKVLR